MGLKKILASMCVLASAGAMAQVQLNDNTVTNKQLKPIQF